MKSKSFKNSDKSIITEMYPRQKSAKSADKNTDKIAATIKTTNGQPVNHVAFIMDGNGRWAKKRLLPRSLGHKEGLKTIKTMLKAAKEQGITYSSFFAFSTENWKRPKDEVDALMQLLETHLPPMAAELLTQNIKLVFSGDTSIFSPALQRVLKDSSLGSGSGAGGVVNICLNYGGRQEIVRAANSAVLSKKQLTEAEFCHLLNPFGLPDPDLLIRTGGEKRISNFMLYQLAYTELFFSDKLWPDFKKSDFLAAINDFKARNRRFGAL